MKLSPIEKMGIILWFGVPILALWAPKETAAEWIICVLYVGASIMSILDVSFVNKALTTAAYATWSALLLIGITVENPDTFSIVAWLIGLERGYDGNGWVIGGLAVLSLVILSASLAEEMSEAARTPPGRKSPHD